MSGQGPSIIHIIRVPLIVAVILIVISIANSHFGWEPRPSAFVSLSYLVIRILLAISAGYLVTARAGKSIWTAATAGALVFLAELFVSAVWFVLLWSWADVFRVVQAFLLFFWAPAILGAFGGIFGLTHQKWGRT